MSENSVQNLIYLTGVAISGLPDDVKNQTETFVRGLVSGTAEYVAALALPMPVNLNVICTPEYEATVDRIYGDYGVRLTGPYQATKNAVAAACIPLHTRNRNPPEFTIVLNAEVCREELVTRYYLIAHEFGHVLIEAQLLADEPPRDLRHATTIEQSLENMAEILLDEAKADRLANWACSLLLRRNDGEPISLANQVGFPLVASAGDLLQLLCHFAMTGVQRYRETSLGLEELIPRASALISELLVVLTHVVTLYEPESRLDELQQILSQFPGFGVYVEDSWPAFIVGLTGKSETEPQKKLLAVFTEVLANVGLRVEDLEDGRRYVHVHQPRFCTDSDPSDS